MRHVSSVPRENAMMQVHELKETPHDAFKKHTKAIIRSQLHVC